MLMRLRRSLPKEMPLRLPDAIIFLGRSFILLGSAFSFYFSLGSPDFRAMNLIDFAHFFFFL